VFVNELGNKLKYLKMSKLLLFLLLLTSISFGQNAFNFWELMSQTEKEHFLNNSNINKLVLDYYGDKFKVNDDEQTFRLIDTLTHKNEYFPFYYFLFNEICAVSDGALSEAMGPYCLKMLLNEPNFVINHFTFERKNFGKSQYLYQLYASFIGEEFYFYNKKMSELDYGFPEFKEMLLKELKNTSSDNSETLELFFIEIIDNINKME